MIEVIGFVAFLSNVVGNIMLTRKIRAGWIVRLFSITVWGIYATRIPSPSLMANAITFFGINCYGFWNWGRKRQQ